MIRAERSLQEDAEDAEELPWLFDSRGYAVTGAKDFLGSTGAGTD